MSSFQKLTTVLRSAGEDTISSVLSFDLASVPLLSFDFSEANHELSALDLTDRDAFSAYIFGSMDQCSASVGIGRYDEDRTIYRHSPLFDGQEEARTIHLGIDLFAAAGTAVHAPLDSAVHSCADNRGVGNYGPTVILGHRLAGIEFFTLYGHLARSSVADLRVGDHIARGTPVAELGTADENGGWPPHLHFQIITDIGVWRGDYPGVATPSERQHWLNLCPDPNLLLRIPPEHL